VVTKAPAATLCPDALGFRVQLRRKSPSYQGFPVKAVSLSPLRAGSKKRFVTQTSFAPIAWQRLRFARLPALGDSTKKRSAKIKLIPLGQVSDYI